MTAKQTEVVGQDVAVERLAKLHPPAGDRGRTRTPPAPGARTG